MAITITEPDGVAGTEHDVVGASASLNTLMIIVAHRIGIGELLEIRRVPLLNVEEAHRGRTFASVARRPRLAV